MDSVIFKTALYGCLVIGIIVTYPFLSSLKPAWEKTSPPSESINIASSCWAPEQLAVRDTDFLNTLCNVHFRAYLNTKQNTGTTRIIFSDEQRDSFDDSRQVIKASEPNACADVMIEVLPFLAAQFILALLCRTVANCIRTSSRANCWVLQSAWERCVWSSISGENEGSHNDVQPKAGNDVLGRQGETDMMLKPLHSNNNGNQSEDALAQRMNELINARLLGLSYFLLHLISALAWCVLAIVCFVYLGEAPEESPLGFVSPDGTQHVGGDYFCDAKVRTYESTQRYFIQCVYTISRQIPDYIQQPSTAEFQAIVFGLTLAFCVILFTLEIIYIIFIFCISQPPRRRQLELLMTSSTPGTSGTSKWFGFSDLSLAAIFWKPDIGDINVCLCSNKKVL